MRKFIGGLFAAVVCLAGSAQAAFTDAGLEAMSVGLKADATELQDVMLTILKLAIVVIVASLLISKGRKAASKM